MNLHERSVMKRAGSDSDVVFPRTEVVCHVV